MDVMSLRRGLMMGMAGNRFASGTVTIEENTITLSINIGIVPKSFTIFVSEKELVSNIRNFGGLTHIEENGSIYEVGVSSNATGNSWGGATTLSVDDTATRYVLTIDGTQVDIDNTPLSSARFLAGKTYKWFAYA